MTAPAPAGQGPACASAVARRRVEDVRLARRHRSGDSLAREALVRRYLPLARRLAQRYGGGHEPMDDLFQVASLGLVKAVDRWDADRGHAFSSFAVPTILGEIRRHFRDTTWAVRPPRSLLELSLSVERACEPVSALTGREPTVADLATRLGRTPEAVAEALQAAKGRTVVSLDRPVTEGQDQLGVAADVIGGVDPGYEQADARATIQRLTSILDERAREILRLRFEEDIIQSDIAELVGCSQIQVSRTIRASLERLETFGSASRAA